MNCLGMLKTNFAGKSTNSLRIPQFPWLYGQASAEALCTKLKAASESFLFTERGVIGEVNFAPKTLEHILIFTVLYMLKGGLRPGF